jgi:hypothetical protein
MIINNIFEDIFIGMGQIGRGGGRIFVKLRILEGRKGDFWD